VVPLIAVICKLLWSKLVQIENFQKRLPGYEHCRLQFALKADIATKQDISDMLDSKFERFELRLVNEGRIQPVRGSSRLKNFKVRRDI